MRLLQGDGFAGLGFPVLLKGRIVILIKIPCDIIADIQQGGVGPAGRGQADGQTQGGEQVGQTGGHGGLLVDWLGLDFGQGFAPHPTPFLCLAKEKGEKKGDPGVAVSPAG